jgi:hypothetical protein
MKEKKKSKWELYRFRIDAYTPDTLPMARFATYLSELANMYGETPHVHFVRMEAGSSVMVHGIDRESVPKVMERTEAVKRDKGTVAEMRAYNRINHMLVEDNGTGVLMKARKHEIIRFPGREDQRFKFSSIQQQGEIDGEVIRIGGSQDIVPILLQVEGREISGCRARRSIAKDLARNLFEPVRLFGEGRWDRSADGEWTLVTFYVDRFEVLQESTLSQAVIALRGLQGDWGKNALHEILESRYSKEDGN